MGAVIELHIVSGWCRDGSARRRIGRIAAYRLARKDRLSPPEAVWSLYN